MMTYGGGWTVEQLALRVRRLEEIVAKLVSPDETSTPQLPYTLTVSTQVASKNFDGYPQPTYKANTPICAKCGQIDVRIPRTGIYHVCPPETGSPDKTTSPLNFSTTTTAQAHPHYCHGRVQYLTLGMICGTCGKEYK
jgi:hypothetical protein